MKGLSSSSAAERAKALVEREREIDEARARKHTEAQRMMGEANEAAKSELEAARQLVERRALEQDADIAKAITTRVFALASQFVHAQDTNGKAASPRVTAGEFASTWRALNQRSIDEVGSEIEWRHLGYAFLSIEGDDAINRAAGAPGFFNADFVQPCLAQVYRAHETIVGNEAAPAVAAALRDCEVAVFQALKFATTPSVERARVHLTFGSMRFAREALTRFDENAQRIQNEKNVESAARSMAEYEARRERDRADRFGGMPYVNEGSRPARF